MTLYASLDEASQWICMGCNADLVVGKVEVHYMGSGYPVDLSRCPNCGQVFISENLATVKMAEIEKLLEDK